MPTLTPRVARFVSGRRLYVTTPLCGLSTPQLVGLAGCGTLDPSSVVCALRSQATVTSGVPQAQAGDSEGLQVQGEGTTSGSPSVAASNVLFPLPVSAPTGTVKKAATREGKPTSTRNNTQAPDPPHSGVRSFKCALLCQGPGLSAVWMLDPLTRRRTAGSLVLHPCPPQAVV